MPRKAGGSLCTSRRRSGPGLPRSCVLGARAHSFQLARFAFSSSLSQFSEENMMDPYNLATCFGPSLMSVPEGHDQVSCQAHVNELIKTIIIQHENIFPSPRELEGPVYSRGGSMEDYW